MIPKPAMSAPALRLLAALLTGLALACAAAAQVRDEPQGNTLPEPQPPSHANDVLLHAGAVMARDVVTPQRHAEFARKVDLSAFRKLAVFDGGRPKIIDTLAREQINRIYGKPRWQDLSLPRNQRVTYDPVFTWLDLIFNVSYYADRPVIHVEVLDLRRQMLTGMAPDEQENWLRIGRLTPRMFGSRPVQQALSGADSDLRLLKGRNQVMLAVVAFDQPDAKLMLVSPRPGSEHWAHLSELTDSRAASAQAGHAPLHAAIADPQVAAVVREQFLRLAQAWRSTDADTVNDALRRIAEAVPRLNPDTYPAAWKRTAEHLYNATRKFTIGYLAYFVSTILLLISLGVPRPRLRIAGIALLLLGFAVHLAGMLVRGLLADRIWTIHNQFESFIAISLFAVLVGILIMLWRRQWIFGAAAAALGTCTLLFANTVDIPSNEVAPVAGILATSRILYVHVNLVLASYGLIGIGFFISMFYLAVHYLRDQQTARLAAAGLGADVDDPDVATLHGPARVLHELDRAQLVVLQLAFWILGVGILLGAYWADHAWGRWWAWDPKETWALITWIIYLMVIHLRFTVRDRGLVTAWMSVVGFFVMLWTYWGVNLLLAGLHSYA